MEVPTRLLWWLTSDTFNGGWMWREELIAKAMEIWTPEIIEDALGADADGVLPDGLRLTGLRVRLARFHLGMLEHFAERDRTTVSATLTRELDAVASAHAEELGAVMPRFADALTWPAREHAPAASSRDRREGDDADLYFRRVAWWIGTTSGTNRKSSAKPMPTRRLRS